MSEEVNDYELNISFGEPEDIDDMEDAMSKDQVSYSDPGWNDYVMAHFLPTELYNGKYPTLNGMRRVTELLLGQVVSSKPIILNSSLDDSTNGRAYCVYEIQINNFLGSRHFRTYCGAADSFGGNTDKTYAIYPVAIAEGRAEARAYRKALLLTTVAAEEIKGNEKSFESVLPDEKKEDEYNEKEPLSHGQKVALGVKCSQLKINKDSFFELYAKENGKEVAKLNKQDGINLMKELTTYANQTKEIPGEIK